MAFILASGEYRARLEQARQRDESPWPAMRWVDGPGAFLIGLDALSSISGDAAPDQTLPDWRVLFDGYLSNTAEIVDLLKLPASEFAMAPADLIRTLLRQHGRPALHRLSGCFVLAAIDQQGQLCALRDRLGGRTIYHPRRQDQHGFMLASRSAWVQRLCGQAFEPDPAFMASHFGLQNGPPPGHSAFAAVRELIPGEALYWTAGQIKLTRPAIDLTPDFDYRNPADCVARFLELLEQAVAATLPPSGDVACMLSGGLDSGPIAAIADRQLAGEGRRLRAISWALDAFPESDERQWIEMAGARFSTPPDLFDASPELPFSRLDPSMISEELPAYNSFRPLILGCYRRARAHGCQVLLNANGGDGLYPPYRLLNLDRVRRRHWAALWRDLTLIYQHRGLGGMVRDRAVRELALRGVRRRPPAPEWLRGAARSAWRGHLDWPPECREHPYPAYARQLYGVFMSHGRAQEGCFAARFGLARRDPFQNEALVRFMLNAPHSLSFRKGRDKWIMRVATREYLDEAFRWKPRTGWLEAFMKAGIDRNRARLKTLLLIEQDSWREFLDQAWLERLLEANGEGKLEVLISQTVGYSLWAQHWRGQ